MPPVVAHLHQWLGFRFIGLILGAAALATSIQAAQAAERRVALVIGNSDYAAESKLPNPANDAQLIARTLKSQGFAVDVKIDLPKRAMELAIAAFVRQSAGADSAVLYYAGHGAQPSRGGRNYLLPVDARVEGDDTLDIDGIAADRIVEQMERSDNPARIRLVVLDACRNNRLAGRTRSGVRGLSRMSPGDDFTLIAFSANDQEVAQDGPGANSPYAQALSKHLAKANELPLRRIFEMTAADVRAATNQQQKPRTYGDLDSRMLLDGTQLASPKPEPGPGPDAVQIEQQAWAAAQRANSAAAYKAYLAEYPNGRYAAAARVALAGLEPTPRPMEPNLQSQTGTRTQKQPPQQCDRPEVAGCWELVLINALYDPGHPLMKGLDQRAATDEIRQERAQFLGTRLWQAQHAGTVKQAKPRSFIVMMWNVNAAVTDAQITGYKMDMAKEKVSRTVPENVTGKIIPPKSEGLGHPERVYRIHADGISTSLQFSWELVTDKTVIMVVADDKFGVYPNKVTANQGHLFSSESLKLLRNNGSVRGLVPFLSTQ